VLYEIFLQNQWQDLPITLTAEFSKIADLLRLNSEAFNAAQWLDDKSLLEVKHSFPERFDQALRVAYLMIISQGARLGENPKKTDIPSEEEPESPEPTPITPPTFNSGQPSLQQALADADNFFESDDYRIAKVFLEKAISIDPESSMAIAMLAWANFQLAGRRKEQVLDQCKDMIKQAIRIDPNNDKAHLYMGRIYKYEKRNDLAVPHFRRAHIINPRSDEAQEEIRLLEEERKEQNGV
jgi:tetratricopeptide (TPR) repeat protein